MYRSGSSQHLCMASLACQTIHSEITRIIGNIDMSVHDNRALPVQTANGTSCRRLSAIPQCSSCRGISGKYCAVRLQEQNAIRNDGRTTAVAVRIDQLQCTDSLSVRHHFEGRQTTAVGNKHPGDIAGIRPDSRLCIYIAPLRQVNCLEFTANMVGTALPGEFWRLSRRTVVSLPPCTAMSGVLLPLCAGNSAGASLPRS